MSEFEVCVVECAAPSGITVCVLITGFESEVLTVVKSILPSCSLSKLSSLTGPLEHADAISRMGIKSRKLILIMNICFVFPSSDIGLVVALPARFNSNAEDELISPKCLLSYRQITAEVVQFVKADLNILKS